ncbi:MAG TPA: ATP-binding protein [Bacteroidales bacterium]|jgi:predicted AAA+ superfamily ATPase|nr:ATP-binding protein [Bacteroidales bacterium]
MKTPYIPRIADKLLHQQLEASGGVLIQGPKWCGKTTTAQQQAKSALYMDDPKTRGANLLLAETDPEILFKGETPRLIDEWKLAPKLWDAARFEISRRRVPGQFIFTGSSVPPDMSEITHSGTGRFAWVTMRTMSLWESGDSNGNISLNDLFQGDTIPALSKDISLNELAYLTCRGGWPGSLVLNRQAALRQATNYVDAVVRSDISRVDNVSRDAAFARRLLRSYARHQGQQVSIKTIHEDLMSNEPESMSQDTIASYINALKKIFVIEDMPAWNPNLRSRTAIRTSDTRYFVDPSIATAALGLGPEDLIRDMNTFGLFFEVMAVRDLRVYADSLDGQVYHYRDKNGLECDAVLHLRNGKFGLIEIKLGGDSLIEDGAETLKKLADKIDATRMNPPSFLMVLTGVGQYAYRRKDGVWVVPIGCLKD